MKKLLTAALISATLIFNSCDKIDSPYSVTLAPVDTSSDVKNIFLEEFTGATCIECPQAHAEALRLQNIYGSRLIVMSIHSGYFAQPHPQANGGFTYDFRTTTGTDISVEVGAMNSSGATLVPYPKGIIDRSSTTLGSNTTFNVIDWGNWESAITDKLSSAPDASLDISNSYNSTDSTITSSINIKAINDITDPVSICMYVVEDSIVNWQKDGTFDNPSYTHRHVLRGSLNGSFGQSQGIMTSGQSISKTFSAKLMRGDINPDQVYIYAVLVNDNTKEVLQVEEKKLY